MQTKNFNFQERLNKARQTRLDFIWSDFISSIELVIDQLNDEELAGTDWITIKYFCEDDLIYRCRYATTNWSDENGIQYEPEDKIIGSKKILEIPFRDFKIYAKNHLCDINYFDIEDLFDNDSHNMILLDFHIGKIRLEN